MRWVWFLALLAPSAFGQTPDVDLVTASIDPFERLVEPLQGPLSTTMHTHASCLLAEPATGVIFTYAVAEQPTWSTVLVSPATDSRGPEACEAGWYDVEASVTVTVSDQAPAFTPGPIVIDVTAGSGQRQQNARADVNVSAAYFSLLDVQVTEPQVVLAPGASHSFVARATNFGNAATLVESVIEPPPDGLVVDAPAPLTLESKQAGGSRIADDLVFRVTAPEADGFVNRVSLINVRLTSAYAMDDSFPGDESSVSFLVTVRTGGEAQSLRNAVPLAGPLLVIPFVLAALAQRRA
jgi:hypothetical protein